MALFAVIRSRGAAWDASQPMEGQRDWRAHAAFIAGLARDGVLRMVGQLDRGPDVLAIAEAESADAIEQLLAGDPWSGTGLLETKRISRWTLRLGGLD